MKTIEELEKQLRNWTPCRPSDRLRGRIFGRPAAAPSRGSNLARLSRFAGAWGPDRGRGRFEWPLGTWLKSGIAFASAVGLAMVFALHQPPPADSSRSKSSYVMLAAALSNQTLVAYVSPPANQEWNRPSATYHVSNFGELLLPTSLARQGWTNR